MSAMVSPNYDERPAGTAIDTLVLHYTGMATAEDAIARLCNPDAKVSAHYLIKEDGTVLALVPEEKRAWHAGKSFWRGKESLNATSIGIEIVNPGHEFGYRDFKEAQYEALIPLCQDILKRHAIPARNVVGHSDIAPDRKEDPGEKFDWERLAMDGIGLWPEALKRLSLFKDLGDGDKGERVIAMQKKLSEYGYAIPQSGEYDEGTMLAALAFQRHFRQERLDAVWDWECSDKLNVLLEITRP